MIQLYIDRFDANKKQLKSVLKKKHPENYLELVKNVIKVITSDDCESPDPERIHEINDGDYQGTLLYVIGETGYQPSKYWATTVGYGSCSGCDTLQNIREYSDQPPTKDQVEQYMTLSLHIVQGLKEISE